jgi:hypothetical protein
MCRRRGEAAVHIMWPGRHMPRARRREFNGFHGLRESSTGTEASALVPSLPDAGDSPSLALSDSKAGRIGSERVPPAKP